MSIFARKMTGQIINVMACVVVIGSLGACATSGNSKLASSGAPITYKYGAQPVQYASLGAPSYSQMAPRHSYNAARPTAPTYAAPQQAAPAPKPVYQDRFDAASVDQNLYSHQKIGKTYRYKGKSYTPKHQPGYDVVGAASWYGDKFHGKPTASGEIFNKNEMTAAHKTLPLQSVVNVTNLETGKSILVRINDRGPFIAERIIDLSEAAALELGTYENGLAMVRVRYAGAADLANVDIVPQPQSLVAEAPRYIPPYVPPVPQYTAPAPRYEAPSAPEPLYSQPSSPRSEYVPLRENAEVGVDNGRASAPYIPPVQELAPSVPVEAELMAEPPYDYGQGSDGYTYESEADANPSYQNEGRQPYEFAPPADDAAVTLTIKGPIHMATTPSKEVEVKDKPRVIPAHIVTTYSNGS